MTGDNMSDEQNVSDEQKPSYVDESRFSNFQKEMDRKLSNTTEQIKEMLNSLKQPVSQPQTQAGKVSVFDDEEAYAKSIEERTLAKMEEKYRAEQARQQRFQETILSIRSEYPEVDDASSPLMQRAQEIYKSLSPEEQQSPIAMKASVSSAASELGVRPKSKRKQDSDNFSMSASSSSSSPRRSKNEEIDPATEQFAALLGLDLSDPKNKESRERIKNKHGRKTYNRYE